MKEKKYMRVVKDNKQTKVYVPKKFVDKLNIKKEDEFEFTHDDINKTLNAKLIKR